MSHYNIIDIFSGAGGLTEGFRDNSFKIVKHIEKDIAASQTLLLRDIFYYLQQSDKLYLYNKYLNNEITFETLLEHTPPEIHNKMLNIEIGHDTIDFIFNQIEEKTITGIIGGPPCQAYSTIGRAANRNKKDTDERIYLYRYYVEFLKKYRPNFFVFENVKGLLSFKDINGDLLFPKMQEEFREIGYSIDYRLINAADYGVPQKRERIIIFGVPDNSSKLIEKFFNALQSQKRKPISVKTALSDLPQLHQGQEKNQYQHEPNDYVRKYFRKNTNILLTQNIARPHREIDLKIYKEVALARSKGKNLKYNELDKSLITHKHTDKFLDRFKALDWNQPAHTVVAHIAKDGHHYIHPDIEQNRSITVREAARLQGFPDDFYFENSRTSAFTQIGNAVPPILSKKIAQAIKMIIKL
ncbi:DNA cytosine methyltransferase [Streptococcus hyointestinalis]|uniref:DNA cytosine methyltransferase n=1 Tax=Streptococcus hyointestinalis TaxID=1337 RepID=UPI0035185825